MLPRQPVVGAERTERSLSHSFLPLKMRLQQGIGAVGADLSGGGWGSVILIPRQEIFTGESTHVTGGECRPIISIKGLHRFTSPLLELLTADFGDVLITPVEQITHSVGTHDIDHLAAQHLFTGSSLKAVMLRALRLAQCPFRIQKER